MNVIEWIYFISLRVLLPAIAIAATVFLLFWVRSILHRQKSRLNEIDQKLERIADKIDYHIKSHNQLSDMMGGLKVKVHDVLKIEESNKIIVEKIDDLKDLIQAIYSTNIHSQKVRAYVQKIDHDIQGLRETLANINSVVSDISLPFFDLAIKESVGRTSELTAITPEIHPVEPPFSEWEKTLIEDFNKILADAEQEQDFRQRYNLLAPASCTRDGIIDYAIDNENLWIFPQSDNSYAVLLPSRHLLTKPTLLTTNGEIASRLIGSCFEITMRDDIERAHLKRFADAEILVRNASGQISKARIKKKGQLELPFGKR